MSQSMIKFKVGQFQKTGKFVATVPELQAVLADISSINEEDSLIIVEYYNDGSNDDTWILADIWPDGSLDEMISSHNEVPNPLFDLIEPLKTKNMERFYELMNVLMQMSRDEFCECEDVTTTCLPN